jgi:CBS domain-containing protein
LKRHPGVGQLTVVAVRIFLKNIQNIGNHSERRQLCPQTGVNRWREPDSKWNSQGGHVDRPYLLPRDEHAIAVTSPRRHHHKEPLRLSDPAARAMTDFRRDPPLTVAENLALEQVLDEMFRAGVRCLLVVRESIVTGLITAEHVRGDHTLIRAQSLAMEGAVPLRVADVMTPSPDVPAIDWQVIEQAQIRDLVEIFAATEAEHLVVLESETVNRSHVRGLIHRARLERQLGTRCGTAL